MKNTQGRAIGGTLLGGLAGGVVGILVGGFLGPLIAGIGRHPEQSLLGMFDACAGFVFMLIGAGVGGVLGAVGGAVLGAGWATTPTPPQEDYLDADPSSHAPEIPVVTAAPTTQTELRNLKERIAELEARKKGIPAPTPSETVCTRCGQPRPPAPGLCPSCGEA